MAEIVKDDTNRTPRHSSLSLLAFLVATIALIVAWLAYNRSGQDLESRIQQHISEAINQTREAAPKDFDVNVER